MDTAESGGTLAHVVVSAVTFPGNLAPELTRPKHRIHQQFEVVAGSWVAMEVDAAGRLQDAVQFDHARRHHREVGHHVIPAKEREHRLEEIRQLLRPVGHDLTVGALGLLVPMPGVVEGMNLGGGPFAARLLEQNVVRGVGVERRVEVDEIDALIRDVLPQDVQVIAKVELVLPVSHASPLSRGGVAEHGSRRGAHSAASYCRRVDTPVRSVGAVRPVVPAHAPRHSSEGWNPACATAERTRGGGALPSFP